jgi:hypothetical protein
MTIFCVLSTCTSSNIYLRLKLKTAADSSFVGDDGPHPRLLPGGMIDAQTA